MFMIIPILKNSKKYIESHFIELIQNNTTLQTDSKMELQFRSEIRLKFWNTFFSALLPTTWIIRWHLAASGVSSFPCEPNWAKIIWVFMAFKLIYQTTLIDHSTYRKSGNANKPKHQPLVAASLTTHKKQTQCGLQQNNPSSISCHYCLFSHFFIMYTNLFLFQIC